MLSLVCGLCVVVKKFVPPLLYAPKDHKALTRWSANGKDQWLEVDFGAPQVAITRTKVTVPPMKLTLGVVPPVRTGCHEHFSLSHQQGHTEMILPMRGSDVLLVCVFGCGKGVYSRGPAPSFSLFGGGAFFC